MQRLCGCIPVRPIGGWVNKQAVPLSVGRRYSNFYRVAEGTKTGSFDIYDGWRHGRGL